MPEQVCLIDVGMAQIRLAQFFQPFLNLGRLSGESVQLIIIREALIAAVDVLVPPLPCGVGGQLRVPDVVRRGWVGFISKNVTLSVIVVLLLFDFDDFDPKS